ncbi:hypothetical protein ACOMHN_042089 [Nucella lapillus]
MEDGEGWRMEKDGGGWRRMDNGVEGWRMKKDEGFLKRNLKMDLLNQISRKAFRCSAFDEDEGKIQRTQKKVNRVVRQPNTMVQQITYSEKYYDDEYEYRHVILTEAAHKHVPRNHLMTETEWRNIGVQQSPGWEHYMVHNPEPHILLFRRPLPGKGSGDSNERGELCLA